MWESLLQGIQEFLDRFIEPPSGGGSGIPWSLEQIIRAESTHALFSCFFSLMGFSLIWTIYTSEKYSTRNDQCIFRYSLLFGCTLGFTVHIILDGFTNLC